LSTSAVSRVFNFAMLDDGGYTAQAAWDWETNRPIAATIDLPVHLLRADLQNRITFGNFSAAVDLSTPFGRCGAGFDESVPSPMDPTRSACVQRRLSVSIVSADDGSDLIQPILYAEPLPSQASWVAAIPAGISYALPAGTGDFLVRFTGSGDIKEIKNIFAQL